MKLIDLGYGNSVAVRKAFVQTCSRNLPLVLGQAALESMDYPPFFGDEKLIELTKTVIKRQTTLEPPYILITNGATGGVTIVLRAYKQMGYNFAMTRRPPYFPLYPPMVKAAGLNHITEGSQERNTVFLLDTPSNPQGLIRSQQFDLGVPTIFDAVYHNNVYTPGYLSSPPCDAVVGSYSKLLGINGLRVGYIGCYSPLLYERLKELVMAEYSGISASATSILMQTAGQMNDQDWNYFEHNARLALDDNRDTWSKLGKYFGRTPVWPYGMFYYAPMDETCKKLIEKSQIIWTKGSSMGTTDDFGRFNLGQDRDLIKRAVRDILKNDQRKMRDK